MQTKTAFVDEQIAAREFHTGDIVRIPGDRETVLSPYVGRVLYSNPALGTVHVQWPWGDEVELATRLIHEEKGLFSAPEFDTSLSTWESSQWTETKDNEKRTNVASRLVQAYEEKTLPLYRSACWAWHVGLDEVGAFRSLAAAYSDEFGTDTVRRTIQNIYAAAYQTAIYWKDTTRRYKVTKRERASGVFYCPRCRNVLKPRTYRSGQKILLCSDCKFGIHPRDLR